MALHPDFPRSPHAILDPGVRWFPADEALREQGAAALVPPLVHRLRQEVKAFRDSGYAGASDTSRSLLNWWFTAPHLAPDPARGGDMTAFQYFFAQREALETIVYLYDKVGAKDKFDLMRYDSTGAASAQMFHESWRRYVVKMATGTGKTKVMSLALAWSYFHKLYEPDSTLARNFLLIAPNIIVLDRLRKDFDGLRIFSQDPVLPENGFDGRNWRDDFQLTLHVQDEVRANQPIGNIFLSNIHRVYSGDNISPSPDDDNSMDYFLGKRPTGATTDSKVDLGDIVRDIDELMVINDEAHHIHDSSLAWFKSIEDIHNRLLQKDSALSLQLDVTATPKHNKGAIFVQTIPDYSLVEAISQDVVKHPVLPDPASRARLEEKQSIRYTEKYADYLDLGVIEWRKAFAEHEKLGKKAILFVMTDDTKNCDEVAEYLEMHNPDLKDAVLVIHTKNNGEISEASSGRAKEELEKLRIEANEIDSMASPYKAIVSVMMLKEGWDVRNVTTIVGLRPYSAKSNILPEQTLGRGLRKMYSGLAEPAQAKETVSVIGTDAFMEFVESIQAEGVTLEQAPMGDGAEPGAGQSLVIEVDWGNKKKDIDDLDIEIPVLSPRIYREYRGLEGIDVSALEFQVLAYREFSENERREIVFRDVATNEVAHATTLDGSGAADYRNVIEYFAGAVMKDSRLVSGYDVLYGKIKDFARGFLFGRSVDLESMNTLRNLSESAATAAILDTFKRAINALTVKDRGAAELRESIKLSETRPFVVNYQPCLMPNNSVFNRIVGDGGFELTFASFLEGCGDVRAFGKNYLAVHFQLDYVKANGDLSSYYPDFLVKLHDGRILVVETKGREELDLPQKMARLKQWCGDVNTLQSETEYDFVYVDEKRFTERPPKSFGDLLSSFTQYK